MKNDKGVSLLEIVISIIILMIIALFAVYSSQNSVPRAKAAELYSEMKSVQQAVNFIKMEFDTKNDFELEQGKHYDKTGDEEGGYIIYGNLTHSNGSAAEYLGIDNIKRDYKYVISYDPDDSEYKVNFMLVDSVNIQGTGVTTLKQLEDLIGTSK